MSNQAFNLLAPESWKSARARNVSQTIALDWGGCQEVKTRLNPFGTGILEVCESPERVADHCFGLGGSQEVKTILSSFGTGILEV